MNSKFICIKNNSYTYEGEYFSYKAGKTYIISESYVYCQSYCVHDIFIPKYFNGDSYINEMYGLASTDFINENFLIETEYIKELLSVDLLFYLTLSSNFNSLEWHST